MHLRQVQKHFDQLLLLHVQVIEANYYNNVT